MMPGILKQLMAGLVLFSMQAQGQETAEAGNNMLKDCPSSPNCVSSVISRDDNHYIDPLSFQTPAEKAWLKLKSIVLSQPRTKITASSEEYMRFEFRSLLFRFVDDVEFQMAGGVIHVRSASRVGYSDLGVNRRRVENIRRLMESQVDESGG